MVHAETKDQEMIEEASKRHCWPEATMGDAYEGGFQNGVIWRDQNPSEKVKRLLAALKSTSHSEHDPGFCMICDALREWEAK